VNLGAEYTILRVIITVRGDCSDCSKFAHLIINNVLSLAESFTITRTMLLFACVVESSN